MRARIFSKAAMFVVALAVVLGGLVAWNQLAAPASALDGAEIVGNPHGATTRALLAPQPNSKVKRVVYFAAGLQTPVGGTTTPVVSDTQCGQGAFSVYRLDAYLVGTMTGTAPTLTILWQNSIDGGTTWVNVGTWTTINATVTPATQSQVVSDISNATTAVAYGDCWRVTKTYGGTGSVGANVKIVGFDK